MENESAKSTEATEKPLLSLRYRTSKRLFWLLTISPFIFLLVLGLVISIKATLPLHILDIIIYILILAYLTIGMVDLALFFEIRVYGDRIVKEWYLLGQRQLRFADAGLVSSRTSWLGVGSKALFRSDLQPWRWCPPALIVIGITYQEALVRESDVQQMDRLLADLSGRDVAEFREYVTFNPLLRDNKGHADSGGA